MFRYGLLFISSLLFSCVAVYSQTKITGIVVDKFSKQPIEFASITILHLPDSAIIKGTVTDKKGKYSLVINEGRYLVKCSFIGYAEWKSLDIILVNADRNEKMDTIELAGNSSQLAEVKVTANKMALNTSIDRKIYNVDQDIMSKSGAAADILNNIPSVEVDIDGNVSLRGSGNVLILINGKPSPMMGKSRAEVLAQLPANSIERIEVITNPSARYRPDGTSGIINIVLKKQVRNGFNGSVTVNVGNRDRYNGNIVLNYKPKNLNLFGSYSIRSDNRRRFNFIDRENVDSATKATTGYFTQDIFSGARPFANILNGGIDYTINEHNSVGVSGTYFHRKQVKSDVNTYSSFNAQHALSENYDRLRYDPEYEIQKSAMVYFQHQFAKEDHELRIEWNSSLEDEVEDNHFTTVYRYPLKSNANDNTLIKQGLHQNQITVDYSYPISENSKLEAGYDGLFNRDDLDFYGEYFDVSVNKFVKDAIKSNRFLYNGDIHALYATYQQSFKKFGFSVGARAEQAFTTSKLITIDSLVPNNYFNLYPTLHLSYKLKDNSEVQLNYSKRVNRPEADELNPFPEYQDPRNLRAGNPLLLPEIIHSVEAGYKWQNAQYSFVPSIYYRYKKDGFTSVVVALNDTTLLATTQNLSNDQSAGVEMIFSAKKGKWFTGNVSSNVFYNTIDASGLGFSGRKSIVSMTAKWQGNFTFSKSSMIQLSANYRSARLTPQGKSLPTFFMNIGMRKDLLKNKMTITFTASDIFRSLVQKNKLNTFKLNQTTTYRRDAQIIYLGINYKFGVVKKPKEEKLQFDNNL